MKILILPKGVRKEMSFEEVYKMYTPLMNKQAYIWVQYDRDDIFQTASIGLWKAYKNYDIERGFTFGTLAKKYVINEVLRYHLKHKPKSENKTAQIKSVESLQSTLRGKNGDETELMEVVGVDETFSSDVIDQVILRKIFSQFSERQRFDIINYIDGYSKSELIEGKNTSTYQAKKIVKRSFIKFRNLYIKEMVL
jgi:RNA polymerase sigma factor (sigma-70 family)